MKTESSKEEASRGARRGNPEPQRSTPRPPPLLTPTAARGADGSRPMTVRDLQARARARARARGERVGVEVERPQKTGFFAWILRVFGFHAEKRQSKRGSNRPFVYDSSMLGVHSRHERDASMRVQRYSANTNNEVKRSLAALLNKHPKSREVMRELAEVEDELMNGGIESIEDIPRRMAHKALGQLDMALHMIEAPGEGMDVLRGLLVKRIGSVKSGHPQGAGEKPAGSLATKTSAKRAPDIGLLSNLEDQVEQREGTMSVFERVQAEFEASYVAAASVPQDTQNHSEIDELRRSSLQASAFLDSVDYVEAGDRKVGSSPASPGAVRPPAAGPVPSSQPGRDESASQPTALAPGARACGEEGEGIPLRTMRDASVDLVAPNKKLAADEEAMRGNGGATGGATGGASDLPLNPLAQTASPSGGLELELTLRPVPALQQKPSEPRAKSVLLPSYVGPGELPQRTHKRDVDLVFRELAEMSGPLDSQLMADSLEGVFVERILAPRPMFVPSMFAELPPERSKPTAPARSWSSMASSAPPARPVAAPTAISLAAQAATGSFRESIASPFPELDLELPDAPDLPVAASNADLKSLLSRLATERGGDTEF